MPSIYFTEEHDSFRAAVRRFVEEEVAPHADEWEAARAIPRDVFRRMAELGFLGICFPDAYGGADADIFFAIAFLEELARSRMGGFCAAVSVQEFMATQHIFRQGSEELKRRYLTPSITGQLVGALAITEPDTGSDVAAIRTRAVRDGDVYVVSGAKTFITNGADGDFCTLAVKTLPDAGVEGVSLLAVDLKAPGVSVTRRLSKMGWHSSDTAELLFEEARVPVSQRIGEENMGFYYLMEAFQLERLAGAAIAVGSAVLCLETTTAYLKTRQAFGKPLSRFQVLTHRLAGLAAELEAARQLTYQAAWLLQNGHDPVRECSMAKLVATELGKRVSDDCLQCFGGYGFMEEYPISRFYRDARAATIVAGTSEIMREIIARIMIEGEQPGRGRASAGVSEGRSCPVEPAVRAAIPQVPEKTVEGLMRSLPGRIRSEKVAGWRACFHFRLKDSDHPDWTVRIEEGMCAVEEGLQGSPDCLVQMKAETFLGIETGATNPQVAFMMGKVKVSDVGQMMRYVKAFRPIFT
ncbi:MAG: acyl-CoA dehydrogenase family protein [Acidobacteria bacterium]|nr:acyl-CoA dehydrogenase family protein [Acidobacteriota bacterium]